MHCKTKTPITKLLSLHKSNLQPVFFTYHYHLPCTSKKAKLLIPAERSSQRRHGVVLARRPKLRRGKGWRRWRKCLVRPCHDLEVNAFHFFHHGVERLFDFTVITAADHPFRADSRRQETSPFKSSHHYQTPISVRLLAHLPETGTVGGGERRH